MKIHRLLALISSILTATGAVYAQVASPTPGPIPSPTPDLSVNSSARNSDSSATDGQPKDTALLKAIGKYVVVLNRPVLTYHWFKASGRDPIWRTAFSADVGAGYDHVVNLSHGYFQSLCLNDATKDPADCTSEKLTQMTGRENVLGPGLYLATDPIATADYATSSNWVLLQLRLPKGFRVAEITNSAFNNSGDSTLSPEAITELNDMSCRTILSMSGNSAYNVIAEMLTRSTSNRGLNDSLETQKCTLNIRRILRERLRIDGIYYGYEGTQFDQCSATVDLGAMGKESGNVLRSGAFVVVNPSRIKPTDVKVFNSQTRDDLHDRVEITSLFYETDKNSSTQAVSPAIARTIQYYNEKGVAGLAGYQVISFSTNGCYTYGNFSNICGDWYKLQDANGKYTYAPLTAPPDDYQPAGSSKSLPDSKISAKKPPSGMKSMHQGLLWTDLDGVDKDAKLDDWIKENLLDCQDITPFVASPNLRYRSSSALSGGSSKTN